MMKKYILKSLNIFFWLLDKVSKRVYIRLYPKYLHFLGIDVDANDVSGTWISPTTFFDSSQYNLIKIGKQVTISFDCVILVHDYSIVHAARAAKKNVSDIVFKKVEIGNNVFIGARSTILPGTIIGDNCIIGSGAVVKGILEPNYIYAGNPCKKIGTIENLVDKYVDLLAP